MCIDYTARLTFDTEIWGCRSYELEWCGVMQSKDRLPLLVGRLVNHSIPSVARIVHNDVDLAIAEISCLLDQLVNVRITQHIAWNGDRAATGGVDVVGDFLCLGWKRRYNLIRVDESMYSGLESNHSPPSMSDITTLAPSFANSLAVSAPMPWPEPVMMAT